MKKISAICIVLILALALSFSAFAAPGSFISSPSGNNAPTLVDYTRGEGCVSEPNITGYGDRDKLSEEDRAAFEKAYGEISNTDDLSKLVPGLNKEDLGVSDFFDLSFSDCDKNHEGHGEFDLTLKPDSLKNFEALVRKTENGWEKVTNAKVENGHLRFTADSDAIYAIVVNTRTGSPQTGDNANIALYAVLMAVSAVSIVFIGKKIRVR